MKRVISTKGQIVIPKPIRDRLGLRLGQVLECHEERGRFVAARTSCKDPVGAVYGVLRLRASSDTVLTRLRGDTDMVSPQ
jgi:AbrB family looped-hinge helix DNA binding protein